MNLHVPYVAVLAVNLGAIIRLIVVYANENNLKNISLAGSWGHQRPLSTDMLLIMLLITVLFNSKSSSSNSIESNACIGHGATRVLHEVNSNIYIESSIWLLDLVLGNRCCKLLQVRLVLTDLRGWIQHLNRRLSSCCSAFLSLKYRISCVGLLSKEEFLLESRSLVVHR